MPLIAIDIIDIDVSYFSVISDFQKLASPAGCFRDAISQPFLR